jgi:hypothetical protein
VLGKIDLEAMYKITTQERLLQNLAYEYEKFADPRLVTAPYEGFIDSSPPVPEKRES